MKVTINKSSYAAGIPVTVLDKGYVKVVDLLGSDLTVVNAARVSFGSSSDVMGDKDRRLVEYLAKNHHDSPFRHVMVTFHIKWPDFVARQTIKHTIGINGSEQHKDHAWNEISGRYVELEDVYFPKEWRAQSDDNKQASKGLISAQQHAKGIYDNFVRDALASYRSLIDMGVARELARIVLPFSTYTEVIWTASMQAIVNFVSLRDHPHAQYEVREYAKVIDTFMTDLFPETYPIMLKYKRLNHE
jgi:thymidylate synthase (FAD)